MTSTDSTPIRVLIVEDDRAVAELHSHYLAATPQFVEVGRVHSIAAALPLLETAVPDLILLDVFLPDGTGMDLLRHLRMTKPDAFDVIVITAASDRVNVERALRLGASDYLLKPFTRPDFTRRLASYARAREARRAAPEKRPLTQADIDALRDPESRSRLPKGLAASTNALVSDVMRGGGVFTATEVAEQVGISRVSARRYLEQLVREGRVVSRHRYGEPGRPKTEYAWNEDSLDA